MTAEATPGQGGTPDLGVCDREPIHLPGAIQPHGLLVALQEPSLTIVAASANLGLHVGLAAEAAIGRHLSSLVAPTAFNHIADLLSRRNMVGENPFPLRFLAGVAAGTDWQATLHRHGGLALLEAEMPSLPLLAPLPGNLFAALSAGMERLQSAQDLRALWVIAVREIRRLTGFERVKLYRFHPDASGEVVAEDRVEHMPPYLGLHFPASDIPQQARELYRRNPDRLIPDVGYTPVPILASPALGGRPIDLSYAQLRSVSPVHVQYLRNMRVGSSMSISILCDGELWGLIACHHRNAHHVGPEIRQACRLIAQMMTWQQAMTEATAAARHGTAVRALQSQVLAEATRGEDHGKAILRHGKPLLDLMGAGGFAMVTPETVTRIGSAPAEADIRALAEWIVQRQAEIVIFETDRLAFHYAPGGAYAQVASGVLAVPLSRSPQRMLLWFRPEVALTVAWGGNPGKPVESAPGMPGNLTPRNSFAVWREQVRGRARPWHRHEMTAAAELRDLVLDVLVRRADETAAINARLARSNDEQLTFAAMASHDITEPVGQIEDAAGTLGQAAGTASNPADQEIVRRAQGIAVSSRRLRLLLDDLKAYSQVGRETQSMAPAPLADLLAAAKGDLAQAIAEAAMTVSAEGRLPEVLCDRGKIQRVLHNLLADALACRHPDRPLQVSVSATIAVAAPRRGRHAMVRVAVTDNGVDIGQRCASRVFEPTPRMPETDFCLGGAIRLAICRKIIEQHGGTIGIEAAPGERAIIWFTLPAARWSTA